MEEFKNKQLRNGEIVTPLGTFSESVEEKQKEYNVMIGLTLMGLSPVSFLFYLVISNQNNIIDFLEFLSFTFIFIFGISGAVYLIYEK